MAEHSYPFDAGDGAAIDELQWSYMARSWQTNGVDAPGPSDSALKVEATGQPFTLLVRAGHAKLSGFHYHLDADQTILFEGNQTTSVRVDRVVLALDRDTNTVSLKIKTGVSGSSAPPAIDRSWETTELPLAVYTVRANSDTVDPGDLIDAREFVSKGVQMLSLASPSTGARQLAEGEIGYDPVAKHFYAQEASARIQIGEQPDLSPYLTKSSAASTYSELGHTHPYMPNTVSSGGLSFPSPWVSDGSGWEKIGNITHIWGVASYGSGSSDEAVPNGTVICTFPLSAGPMRTFRMPFVGQGYSLPGNAGVVVERTSTTARARVDFFQVFKQTWYYFSATFISG